MTRDDSHRDAVELPLLDDAQLGELESLDARQGGGLLRRLVEIFESQGPDAFDDLRRALEAGDADAVAATAHSLKGGYRSLGVARAAALAAEIESMGRAQSLADGPRVLAALERCFAASRAALHERLSRAD
ncbi:MAG: Hpt domain-containing protein [Acidobacteriota bacterium]